MRHGATLPQRLNVIAPPPTPTLTPPPGTTPTLEPPCRSVRMTLPLVGRSSNRCPTHSLGDEHRSEDDGPQHGSSRRFALLDATNPCHDQELYVHVAPRPTEKHFRCRHVMGGYRGPCGCGISRSYDEQPCRRAAIARKNLGKGVEEHRGEIASVSDMPHSSAIRGARDTPIFPRERSISPREHAVSYRRFVPRDCF